MLIASHEKINIKKKKPKSLFLGVQIMKELIFAN